MINKNLLTYYLDVLNIKHEFTHNQFLKEDENITIKDYDKSMNILYDSIEKNGIKKEYIKERANTIINKTYKNGKLDEKKLKAELDADLKKIKKQNEDKITTPNILIGIFLTYCIIVLKIVSLHIIASYFVQSGYDAYTARNKSIDVVNIAITPLIEEYAKFISIRNKFGNSYILAFTITNFLSFIFEFSSLGAKLWKLILYRSTTEIMHYITFLIQKYFSKEEEDRNPKIGLIIANIINISYMILTNYFDTKLSKWVFN